MGSVPRSSLFCNTTLELGRSTSGLTNRCVSDVFSLASPSPSSVLAVVLGGALGSRGSGDGLLDGVLVGVVIGGCLCSHSSSSE